ncbi:MAG: hypothetical protein K6F14_04770 [Clostridiales bacterium]|nr:hypothetical protein [Clostridiales bacterium]
MKKALAFILVAIMVVALVACNSGSGTTTTATDKVETTEATTVETTAKATEQTTTKEETTVKETEVTTTVEETTTAEQTTTEVTTEVTTTEEQTTTEEETTTAVVVDPTDPSSILSAAYALKDGEALEGEFTLEGVVTKVGTAYSEQYKNVTFTIAVKGEEARPIDAYRAKGEGADKVKVGDTVKVTGKIKNYKGTIEFDSGCTMVITNSVVIKLTAAQKALQEAGYDPSQYDTLTLSFVNQGYWQSNRKDASQITKIISADNPLESASIYTKFACTDKMFTKDEIPEGSVIVILSGLQYRPEGWVNLTTPTSDSARPGNTTKKVTLVDSAWWGSFTYRAFNISKTDSSVFTAEDTEALEFDFAIFVPKK